MWSKRLILSCLVCTATIWSTGCGARVKLRVLESAAIMTPPDVRTVAVIDRSRAGNVGQGLLGALEGALSGEGVGVDVGGRTEAIRGLVEILVESPRFDVLQPLMNRKDVESDIFARELSWNAARRICEGGNCQGIVALEGFDSDSSVVDTPKLVEEEDEDGKVTKRRVHEVERRTRVVAGWRFYDTTRMTIIDQVYDDVGTRTWSEKGDTYNDAFRRLPSQHQTVQQVGYDLGTEYGRRIAPSYSYVYRKMYAKGDPRLEAANDYVSVQDWVQAATIWEQLTHDPDTEIQGRAYFNLAIEREVYGDLRGALELARAAFERMGNRRTRNYISALQERIREWELLQQQM